MQLTTIVSFTLSVVSVSATFNTTWAVGGVNDERGPCPMMNTLANHGFLPHDGKNITLDNAVKALGDGIGFSKELATAMWNSAIFINPAVNATYFTLNMLNTHNILEHDASLSRSDAYFGNNHVFNQTVFDTTKAYWTSENLTASMLANSKVARMVASKAFNPNYSFTATNEQFSLGEVAAPIIVLGDMTSGTVNRTWVEYFIENEKLPIDLGWTKKSNVTLAQIGSMSSLISNSTSLITGSGSKAATRRDLGDLHSGLGM